MEKENSQKKADSQQLASDMNAPASTKNLTIEEIEQLLEEKQAESANLQTKKAELQSELDWIDREIKSILGSTDPSETALHQPDPKPRTAESTADAHHPISTGKRLTLEIAEQFLADQASADLSQFSELNTDAAAILRTFWGWLNLDGLSSLSDAAAEHLSTHNGRLSLRGLSCLSDAAAHSLNKHNGWQANSRDSSVWNSFNEPISIASKLVSETPLLSKSTPRKPFDLKPRGDHHSVESGLEGVSVLTDREAERLSQHTSDILYLDRLKNISDSAAEILSKHTNKLSLNGLTEISDSAAASLSQHEGWVYLCGLRDLSDTAAERLSEFKGRMLFLSGLGSLTEAAERSIGKHGRWLDLDRISNDFDAATTATALYKDRFGVNRLPTREVFYIKGQASRLADERKPQLLLSVATLPKSAAMILLGDPHSRWVKPDRDELTKGAAEKRQTNVACPGCSAPMMRHIGRVGAVLLCPQFPDCNGSVTLDRKTGYVRMPTPPPLETDIECQRCNQPLHLRRGKRGPWLKCSTYPTCKGRGRWRDLEPGLKAYWTLMLVQWQSDNPPAELVTVDGKPITEGFRPHVDTDD